MATIGATLPMPDNLLEPLEFNRLVLLAHSPRLALLSTFLAVYLAPQIHDPIKVLVGAILPMLDGLCPALDYKYTHVLRARPPRTALLSTFLAASHARLGLTLIRDRVYAKGSAVREPLL